MPYFSSPQCSVQEDRGQHYRYFGVGGAVGEAVGVDSSKNNYL
jgi:hypothetical protein